GLRCWLDRGVDGFRVDVAHGLVKRVGAATGSAAPTDADVGEEAEDRPPMWDQEGVHDIYRDWRRLVDGYPGQRVLVAEAWVESPARLARYVRLDEMHQAFNFTYLQTPWRGEELGLPDHTTLPDSARQDPTWRRSGHTVRGRDGCRVPVPWEADAPAYGFSPSGHSWLPQPAEWAEYALDRQRGVPGSTYELV